MLTIVQATLAISLIILGFGIAPTVESIYNIKEKHPNGMVSAFRLFNCCNTEFLNSIICK